MLLSKTAPSLDKDVVYASQLSVGYVSVLKVCRLALGSGTVCRPD